jgi:hypothetical protein
MLVVEVVVCLFLVVLLALLDLVVAVLVLLEAHQMLLGIPLKMEQQI